MTQWLIRTWLSHKSKIASDWRLWFQDGEYNWVPLMAQFVTCQRLLQYMWTVLIAWNKCYHIMEKSFKINTCEVQFTCKHLLQSSLDWVNCCIEGLYIFFLLIVFSVCANPLAQKHHTRRWERVHIILLGSSNRNKSIPRLSLRKWGYSVNWFIHGNMETQLWDVKTSCK